MATLQAVAHVVLTLKFSSDSDGKHDFLYGLLVSYSSFSSPFPLSFHLLLFYVFCEMKLSGKERKTNL